MESIGGTSYLTELTDSVPSSTNIRYYADLVGKKHLLRSIIEAGTDISELGFKEDIEDVFEVLNEAEKRMMGIANPGHGKAFLSLKDSLPEAWERLAKLH